MSSLSKHHAPFDKGRDGFVMGEGAGVLVLEAWSMPSGEVPEFMAKLWAMEQAEMAYHITSPAPEGEGAQRAIGGSVWPMEASSRPM